MKKLELPSVDPRPNIHFPLYETWVHRLVVWLARHLLPLFAEMRVTGLEHFPRSGAAVVASNHLVTFDVFPLQLALPRLVFFMGKAELFQVPGLYWVFRQLGGFPVYRGERDTWALEHARRILDTQQIVAMFPEGTRSRGVGLGVAKPGAARLAMEAACPVVVVSISGIQDLFRHFPRRAQVQVTIAPPIYPTESDTPLSLTDKMMYLMAQNLPPALRGVYAEVPAGFETREKTTKNA